MDKKIVFPLLAILLVSGALAGIGSVVNDDKEITIEDWIKDNLSLGGIDNYTFEGWGVDDDSDSMRIVVRFSDGTSDTTNFLTYNDTCLEYNTEEIINFEHDMETGIQTNNTIIKNTSCKTWGKTYFTLGEKLEIKDAQEIRSLESKALQIDDEINGRVEDIMTSPLNKTREGTVTFSK